MAGDLSGHVRKTPGDFEGVTRFPDSFAMFPSTRRPKLSDCPYAKSSVITIVGINCVHLSVFTVLPDHFFPCLIRVRSFLFSVQSLVSASADISLVSFNKS